MELEIIKLKEHHKKEQETLLKRIDELENKNRKMFDRKKQIFHNHPPVPEQNRPNPNKIKRNSKIRKKIINYDKNA